MCRAVCGINSPLEAALASALIDNDLDLFLEHLPGNNDQSRRHQVTLIIFDSDSAS